MRRDRDIPVLAEPAGLVRRQRKIPPGPADLGIGLRLAARRHQRLGEPQRSAAGLRRLIAQKRRHFLERQTGRHPALPVAPHQRETGPIRVLGDEIAVLVPRAQFGPEALPHNDLAGDRIAGPAGQLHRQRPVRLPCGGERIGHRRSLRCRLRCGLGARGHSRGREQDTGESGGSEQVTKGHAVGTRRWGTLPVRLS